MRRTTGNAIKVRAKAGNNALPGKLFRNIGAMLERVSGVPSGIFAVISNVLESIHDGPPLI